MANTIHLQADGPLIIADAAEVCGADGTLIRKAASMRLCRCGQSGNKPFCDDAHTRTGFADEARVPMDYVIRKPEPGAPPASPRLTLRTDGPVHCFGEVRILGKDGSAWQGSQANLCRCGQSANKPFCDGTHRSSGFRA